MGGDNYTISNNRVGQTGFASARSAYQPGSRTSLPKVTVASLRHSVDSSVLPLNRTLKTDSPSPVVVAIDCTGSWRDWFDVIYQKMPMFYGQLTLAGILEKPAISYCFIGDAKHDRSPLQVTDFGEGDTLDAKLESLWHENGGGGNGVESYELAAFYYLNRCALKAAVKPVFLFLGDEGYYSDIYAETVRDIIGGKMGESMDSASVMRQLARKFDTCVIRKDCSDSYGADGENQSQAMWQAAFGTPRVIKLNDPRAVIDTMLGAISLMVGKSDLAQYSVAMSQRGQTKQRVRTVQTALTGLSQSLRALPPHDAGPAGQGQRSLRRK
jgi:hypothetical protein